ncbi:hypothetical protein [Kiloniella antarctica]|uniref:Extensin-like C-terminal domain-containing protein n=1 Tax=Kiloniella antarctica TaxID=1550907 RepID=A0ABW5BH09_9PROT
MIFRFLLHSFIILLLTAVTQIGGVAYMGAIGLTRFIPRIAKCSIIYRAVLFLGLYAGLWSVALFVAPQFGRVALPCHSVDTSQIMVQSPLYCAMNRQYVSPELFETGNALAAYMNTEYPDTQTMALDANFPFFDGFPLLPHLSHDDGRKLDIAFYYRTENGKYALGKTKSPIGYWAFEQPRAGSFQPCARHKDILSLRWSMEWFQLFLKDYRLDETRASAALSWLSTHGKKHGVSKVLIEPHLVQRLGYSGKNIRFQGCQAARHDDHIHLQIN